ncbi:hypothetical protein LLG95_09000 [bacterium]|nr:hypothetical protein [bacterium]
MADSPESQPPSQPAQVSTVARELVFLGGIATVAGLEWYLFRTGFAYGLRSPADYPGNMIAIPAFVLIPFALIPWYRICFKWRRTRVEGSIALFMPILAIQCFCMTASAVIYGHIVGLNYLNRDMWTLSKTAKAIESFRADNKGAYPLSIDEVFPQVAQGPLSSAFKPRPRLRYALFASDTTSGTAEWMLWFPGVDGKFDIADGPEMRKAIADVRAGRYSEWLSARLYSPADKNNSSGDLVLSSLSSAWDRAMLHTVAGHFKQYSAKYRPHQRRLDLVEIAPMHLPGMNGRWHVPIEYEFCYESYKPKAWILWMPGPDGKAWLTPTDQARDKAFADLAKTGLTPWLCDRIYDPTNGTKSAGDLAEFGRMAQ